MLRLRLSVFVVLVSTSASIGSYAQWLHYATPGIPRTPDGKPNLAAPTPRTAEGTPDLSGVWMHELTSVAEMRRLYGAAIEAAIKVDTPGMEIGTQHKYALNVFLDFKPSEVPIRPEALAIMRQRAANRNPSDPCGLFWSFPLLGLVSETIKVIQSPRVTALLYEVNNLHRHIVTDGRTTPTEFDYPAYLGYSVGHWDRDVFVVETAGFSDKTLLDGLGHPHSEALRITERFQRRDFGHMEMEVTFDDPKMYTKAFTIKVPHDLLADSDIFEMFCNENEKDGAHMQRRWSDHNRLLQLWRVEHIVCVHLWLL
jgi:hypothetical protein